MTLVGVWWIDGIDLTKMVEAIVPSVDYRGRRMGIVGGLTHDLAQPTVGSVSLSRATSWLCASHPMR
jgi:hypothetical protein